MEQAHKITGGIYLVLDPAMPQELLLHKLELALNGGIDIVQIWNNWTEDSNKLALIEAIGKLCRSFSVPLLINQEWQLLLQSPYLDGVHFDYVPSNFEEIKQAVGKEFIAGITCAGNLEIITWADENQFSYVSFCAMFPSPSAGSCSIVMPAVVRKAREITSMPLFVSGGITPQNIVTLKAQTPFDGVAVISGILSVDNPEKQVQTYKDALSINP